MPPKTTPRATPPAEERQAVPAETKPPLQPRSEVASASPAVERPNRIRELREAKGLSLRELGRRMGLTGPEIYKLETGDRRLTAAHLDKLVPILGEDAATIAGWGPPPESVDARLARIEAKLDELLALMRPARRRA